MGLAFVPCLHVLWHTTSGVHSRASPPLRHAYPIYSAGAYIIASDATIQRIAFDDNPYIEAMYMRGVQVSVITAFLQGIGAPWGPGASVELKWFGDTDTDRLIDRY